MTGQKATTLIQNRWNTLSKELKVAVRIHELNEAGWIPGVIAHVWDFNFILSDKSEVGEIFKVLLGYNGNPSLTEVIAYLGYFILIAIIIRFRKSESKNKMTMVS